MRTSRVRMATLAVFVLVVVACGGGGDEVVGGREIDVCSPDHTGRGNLLSGGGPADPPAPTESPGSNGATCGYETSGAQTRIFLRVYDGEKFYSGDDAELHPDAGLIGGLGTKGDLEPGGIGFLQNDWAVFVSKISGPISDDTLLAFARMVSERLP